MKNSIEIAGEYFELIKKHLKFKKGAFLLYDYNYNTFAPWSISNFDQTTSHRLRIPVNFLEQHKSFLKGPINISDENLLILQPFFSTREFSILERLYICPFYNGDDIFAILLFSEMESMKGENNHILDMMIKISDYIVPKLLSSREMKIKDLSRTLSIPKENILNESDLFIKSLQQKDLNGIYIKLNFMNLINQITVSTPLSDPFRIRQDIQRILSSMVSGTGKAFYSGSNTFLIIISAGSVRNEKLLIHQIRMAMRNFFMDLDGLPDPDCIIRRYPDDGESSKEILDGLL